MTITFGGITFPLAAPSAAGSLLDACDPVGSSLLPYYAALVRHYCSAAFSAVTASAPSAVPYASACASEAAAPADVCFRDAKPSLPLLTLYAARAREAGQATMGTVSDTVEYRLEYVLPQLTAEQEKRVRPMLLAVRLLLLGATYHDGDPNVPGSSAALSGAGVDELEFGEASFDDFEAAGHRLPMLSMTLTVKVSTKPDPNAGPALSKAFVSIAAGGTTDGGLLPGFVEVEHRP